MEWNEWGLGIYISKYSGPSIGKSNQIKSNQSHQIKSFACVFYQACVQQSAWGDSAAYIYTYIHIYS